MSLSIDSPVIIVGAGMAGLTCAVYLKQVGIDALLIEAADHVGGRVRTDVVDGFRLDRGFQILLTAYPEAQRLLNYSALELKPFRSGALIRSNNDWVTFLNPFQEPSSAFQTLTSPIGTLGDKLRIAGLIRQTQSQSIGELFQQPATTTLEFLHQFGFTPQIIDQFFRPFFGGVFLEDALVTSSNFLEFCFRMFFLDDVAVPAQGIGAIPDQLAARLSNDQIRLKSVVKHIDGNQVILDTGEALTANSLVLAVDAAQAARLLGRPAPIAQSFNHTTCTYFATPAGAELVPTGKKRLLMLNPQRSSAVHNLAIMTDVAPSYVLTDGRHEPQTLISVSTQGLETVNEASLTDRIKQELTNWFGNEVHKWQHLRTYHIPQALPSYGPGSTHQPLQLSPTLYQCGDQTAYPSLNAAMQTGREVAQLIISHRLS
ncbi:protoporphyrinogen/coproporphyrinogen oxidase [Spirosoma soli]|uniref:Protoporphyrinogen/coproporphyrinogen oxidase n=1 Tax=Spirosoma soli TaxID=1770529 RepID=A0ABW5M9E3_9BACT